MTSNSTQISGKQDVLNGLVLYFHLYNLK
ncbi:hypothetical protein P5673_010388 [Acropora cervicornis]|uniref:Uncharacterized protein n=1 Tax=Acropora cervicornis TaxID=6130 RepID=A0AAD9V9D1_ACRCE|nr:hypothetical protein P5673_010388 [Acropora cervicornis]